MIKLILALLAVAAGPVGAQKIVRDNPGSDMKTLFCSGPAKYVLRYSHDFSDTLRVPKGSELCFEGGALSGPIIMDGTELTGKVNLRGSSVSGSVTNKVFNASWLCAGDGVKDDAKSINEMISLCDEIYFPKGVYRLESSFDPSGHIGKSFYSAVKSHIGIYRSGVVLSGEEGAEFVSDKPLNMICIFSRPKQIENSVGNIELKGLKFTVGNDGKTFHEFMHTVKTIGVDTLVIKECEFNDFWGDAICLSHYGDTPQTGERTRNQNVSILNNTITGGDHHNNRNGISIISGQNVLIRDNVIRNTSRDDMPGGIDIEPNNSAYVVENIVIENNLFEGCRGTVGAIGIVMLKDGAPGHNISIVSNTIRNCSNGIAVAIRTKGTTSGIEIRDNHIAADTQACKFIFSGTSKDWKVTDNVFEHPKRTSVPGRIKVENLVVRGNRNKL